MNQDASDPQVLPLLAEELRIERERRDIGAVRVRIEVDEVPAPLEPGAARVERVSVERVARDEPVDRAREPWREGETLVVPVYAERLVPRLFLVEEVRITRRPALADPPAEVQAVRLRRERAVVERRGRDGRWHAEDGDVPTATDTRKEG